jgi:hypothetical protein
VFGFVCPLSCVPNVANFSGLSIFDCPFILYSFLSFNSVKCWYHNVTQLIVIRQIVYIVPWFDWYLCNYNYQKKNACNVTYIHLYNTNEPRLVYHIIFSKLYIRYLCFLAHRGVQHIVFFCLGIVSYVSNVAIFCRLSILDCPFGFL